MDAIPEQYHLIVGIGGLVFLLIVVVSAAQKYQAYQVQKEMALRRMLNGVQQLEDLLDLAEGAAIPKKLMVVLRKEILARYVAMRQIHKGIKHINEDIGMAQRRMQGAESMGEAARQAVSDRQQLNRYTLGITKMITFLQENARVAGINATEKQQYIEQLANIRADYMNDFHSREALGLAEQEMWTDASDHLKQLMHYISTHGPATPHVTEIYKRASDHYKQVVMREVPGSTPKPVMSADAKVT
jgi:hypothetical protein